MATSGSTNWIINRNEILTEVAELVGAIPLGKSPTNALLTSLARTLNALVKSLQAGPHGIFIYAIEEKTVNTVANQNYIALSAGTVGIIDAYILEGGIRYPLEIRSRQEFNARSQPSAAGMSFECYVDFSTTPPTMYFYYTPTAVYEVHYIRERRLEDFDAATDDPDLPQEAFKMLVAGLCHDVGPKFGLDTAERDRFGIDFERYKIEFKAGSGRRSGTKKLRPTGMVV